MTAAPARILVTGLYGLRDLVLALPRLAALRTQHPDAHITMIAPVAARDLLLRLRLADAVTLLDDRRAIAVAFWSWWQHLCKRFDRVLSPRDLPAPAPVNWAPVLGQDVSFLLPPSPYILMSLPEGWPVLRAAAFVRKLDKEGLRVVLVNANGAASQRLRTAAPDVHDLVGRIDLSDLPSVAAGAVAMMGGRDGMTALAALAGTRTVILGVGDDPAIDLLPHDHTLWVQSDDLADVSVSDMIKAVMP